MPKRLQRESFSVEFQHAQPNENTGYNTQPVFVIPGSKAAERNARRKKGSVPVLQAVPNRRCEASVLESNRVVNRSTAPELS
jgi:hypothetical protein